MQKQPSFQSITHFSESLESNELFTQYFNEKLNLNEKTNYMQMHFNPTLAEFQLLEKLQKDDLDTAGLSHLKFHWPENTGLFIEVLDYLSHEGYELGKLELLHLVPQFFRKRHSNPKVLIQEVTPETFEMFLELNYIEDKAHSQDLADSRQSLYRYQYKQPAVKFLLATIDKEPVGSLQIFSTADYIEVDNVLTAYSRRKQGVATELLADVKEQAEKLEKDVILLADAEDTPRDMYLNQGFQVIASQIHARKKLK